MDGRSVYSDNLGGFEIDFFQENGVVYDQRPEHERVLKEAQKRFEDYLNKLGVKR